MEEVERRVGGRIDKYWYSPDGEKFRSHVSVIRYLKEESKKKNSTSIEQSANKRTKYERKKHSKKDKNTSSDSEETFEENISSSSGSASESELSKITYFPHSSESDVNEDLVFDIVGMKE